MLQGGSANGDRQGVLSIEGSHSEFGYLAVPPSLPPFAGAPGLDGAAAGFYN